MRFISGLFGGLFALQVNTQTYTGQVSQDVAQPVIRQDMRVQIPTEEPTKVQLRLPSVQRIKSALGFCYHLNNGIVYYIDPNCDLNGRIQLGDCFVAMDGLEPNYAMHIHHNIGNVHTPVKCTFFTQFGQQTFICFRHPIASFGPDWHP